ncbi:hypothetical protein PGT21_030461 [Puccinia graminis f. sp. tritici]|uniref:Uncharacterized protein n=1 Tax=Puccinia graminis f. sp. tritici TaxID=56615 RepID=A0A5B0PCB4_PUCGR|nr:hypothetical protein PGT21_030461 [Puccinia graminis f. sp. tritici]KAA1099227.1 hypothetical protein PGTUg99_023500 [Puccinia graminis f. sp. tritici]
MYFRVCIGEAKRTISTRQLPSSDQHVAAKNQYLRPVKRSNNVADGSPLAFMRQRVGTWRR